MKIPFAWCLCALLLTGCTSAKDEPTPKAIVQVRVVKAEVVDVPLTVDAPASIYPRQQASISAKVTAPIEGLLAKQGDTVARGQLIARLANQDLVAQRVEALEKAKADATNAEAALAQAQKNLDRRQSLYNQGAITAKDLLASQTDATQAKASYDAAEKYLTLLQGTSSPQSGTFDSPGQTAYLNAQLEFTEIHSPFAGVITEQFLYPGDMAKPESPIFTIMDLSVAVARAQVAEDKVAAVVRGQTCSFSSTDLPNRLLRGQVSVVNQAVDPTRRTVEVWCEIANPKSVLKSGVFGSVTVSVGKAPHALVLPQSAVLFKEGSDQGTAAVIDTHDVAHVRDVEANPLPDGRVRVVRGLSPDDSVVVEGGYGLPDGTQVTVQEEAR